MRTIAGILSSSSSQEVTVLCAAAAAKSLQSCPTLCDPTDGSPPGSFVPGILQARLLSGLPLPSPMHAHMLSRFSRVQLSATLWTAAHQAPLSTGFSRQDYWCGLPFPSPMHACKVATVVSDSVRPYGQQPTRLLCPQDSPAKNTGVGCHLLSCVVVTYYMYLF